METDHSPNGPNSPLVRRRRQLHLNRAVVPYYGLQRHVMHSLGRQPMVPQMYRGAIPQVATEPTGCTESEASEEEEPVEQETNSVAWKGLAIFLTIVVIALTAVMSVQWVTCEVQKGRTIDIPALNRTLRETIVGQDAAMSSIVQALTNYADNPGNKPVVLILQGWTGVGKTLTAQVIARHFKSHGLDVHYRISSLLVSNMTVSTCGLSLVVLDDADSSHRTFVADVIQASRQPTVIILVTRNLPVDFGFSDESNSHAMRFRTIADELGCESHMAQFKMLSRNDVRECVRRYLDGESTAMEDSVLDLLSFFNLGETEFAKFGCKQARIMANYVAEKSALNI